MSPRFTESVVEEAAIEFFEELGYAYAEGPSIAPDQPGAERERFEDVVLVGRLRTALARINPEIPSDALEEAVRKLLREDSPSLVDVNHAVHWHLAHTMTVEYRRDDGSIKGDMVRLLDVDDPEKNDWLVVNQFTVVAGQINRRPDIVVFVNGIPLAVIELKNTADEEATIDTAFGQLETYKAQIPDLFKYNAALVISDGIKARIGTISANRERFMPWRTIEGEDLAPKTLTEMEVLLRGVFEKRRFLALVSRFIVFEDEGSGPIKKMAGYHQFHAVDRAVTATIEATKPAGDRRVGVVWHTQGSGKSLTMLFYAGSVIRNEVMANPTIVVLTDRNDLDQQLFGTFARCHKLLRQTPVQAKDRADLREKLRVASGGVVFTTIQKFMPGEDDDRYPLLSNRTNIVVVADEAHRSQYAFIDGFARHMRDGLPNASFIGFTGTPVEATDKNTRAVFGDYISIYDIQRAVEDGATVPIYYESRLAKIELVEAERPKLDSEFEEVTEGEEVESKEKLKSKWAALEALVGAEKRVTLVARDLVTHFENRLDTMVGKGMIVCMSRRICVALYDAIVKLKPQWHAAADDSGQIKVVMTGSASDPLPWQNHIRNKARNDQIAKRLKDPKDKLKLVIVRDMWLTGFDAPCLHTMYIDKPMRGHGLMQAIARVNRVFKDKPGGLVVDYLGLADQLRRALAAYTESGGKGNTAIDQQEAVDVMLEKYEICCGIFHGIDRSKWTTGKASERLTLIPTAVEHVLELEDGKKRCLDSVAQLSAAFALAVPHDEALRIRDDVGYFQAVRAALAKATDERKMSPDQMDTAIRQIISRAISADEVIDVFAAAGLKKPDISILSEEFLTEVRGLPHKNLAVETLKKLLADEIKTRSKRHLVQARSFAEMLERSVLAYKNRAIETAQVIEELIQLAKEMREADKRGESLGLNDDEAAFYEALEVNDSAVAVLGEPTLKTIARELVDSVRKNVTIDWTVRESVRAKLRVIVRRILKKHGYPPDKADKATATVMEQAELLCENWAA